MNRYPLWKNLLILILVCIGFIYALPNLYPPDPAVQISGASSALQMDERVLKSALSALDEAEIDYLRGEITDSAVLVRLQSQDQQLKAKSIIKRTLGDEFVVALNLAATTPEWLSSVGASPNFIGA